MAYLTLNELIKQLQAFFAEKDYYSALKLVNDGLVQFPDQRTILDYWRLSLLARSGEVEDALDAFKEACDHGSWFSEVLLRQSTSLYSLQEDPRFEALVAQNQEVAERDQERQFPFYVLRPEGKCQSGGVACPLLIGLHINGGKVDTSLDFWKPAAALGWLVAAPQSSQALMRSVYVWDDRLIAEKEIVKDFDTLVETYTINPWQTVLAGHSTGCETAIWLTLHSSLEINGFLAINPSGPGIDNLSGWEDMLHDNLRSGLRGYIINGEMDLSLNHENILSLVEMFNLGGIVTELEILAEADQNYQPDYDAAIARGLNFLTG